MCVFVQKAHVSLITGRMDGAGKTRCTVTVTDVEHVGLSLPLGLSLDQPGDNPGDKARHIEAKTDVDLYGGEVELELPYNDDVNPCMSFAFTFTLGKKKKKFDVTGDCPD